LNKDYFLTKETKINDQPAKFANE